MNYYALLLLAPALLIVGVAGFLIPADKSLTSGAPAYNVFHLVFGTAGVAIICSGDAAWVRGFNICFGLIDLYQAAASFVGWFPATHFRWKRADDVLHVIIGIALVSVGLLAN